MQKKPNRYIYLDTHSLGVREVRKIPQGEAKERCTMYDAHCPIIYYYYYIIITIMVMIYYHYDYYYSEFHGPQWTGL